MKLFRIFLLVLISGLAFPAFGSSFHVQVLDPDFLPIDPSTPLPFEATFQPCIATYGGSVNGCIYLENNAVGSTITELGLNFGSANLAGLGITCGSDLFATITGCDTNGQSDVFDIDFSDGHGIPPGGFFVIEESNDAGLTPDEFGTISQNFTFTTTATPEPESLVLLGSGMLLLNTLVRKGRSLAFRKKTEDRV